MLSKTLDLLRQMGDDVDLVLQNRVQTIKVLLDIRTRIVYVMK